MKPTSSPTTQLRGSMDKAIVKLSLPKPLQEIHKWLNNSKRKPTSSVPKKNAVLFNGPKNSGKQIIASMIANQAGKEMYMVRLSKLVSKYIGETEKNLSVVFDMAKDKGWILFFDEADALFGKRTTVKDSHDKYANLDVSYLLQKIEEHNGMIILSSNRKSNIDQAFTRRFQSIIQFPLP